MLSAVALDLYREGAAALADTAARAALDLLQSNDFVNLSSNGASIGDRVEITKRLKQRSGPLPMHTQGNLVGHDVGKGLYLLLLFPQWYPAGVLALVPEKDIRFLSKPKIADESWEQAAVTGIKHVVRAPAE